MPKTILIVDDEDDARAIAVLALQLKTDWILLQATSGQQALDIAAAYQPDLILLDMMMPELDGKATLCKLKENPKTQHLPIILVTAKVEPLSQTDISPQQILAVFAKPFRPLELADQIRAVLAWE
jgi:CheY-like chemotaxis protein